MDSNYGAVVSARFRALSTARALFALRSIGDMLIVVVESVAPVILASHFGSIAGWSGPEAALLIGLGRCAEGIALASARGVDPAVFSETVRLGRFDQVLIRPMSAIGWLVTSEFELRFLFRTAVGLAVAAWCIVAVGVDLGPADVVILAGAVASTAILAISFLVMGAALTLRTVEGSDVANLLALGGMAMAGYPMELYSSALRFTFTFIIPTALCLYVPVITVLDRDGVGFIGPHLLPVVPVAALALIGLSSLAWRAGVRHYQSTGS